MVEVIEEISVPLVVLSEASEPSVTIEANHIDFGEVS